ARSAPGDLLLGLVLNVQAAFFRPLSNFAQLSMFRFDWLKITLVISDVNNLIYNINHISYKLMITK
ncbi:hypothetical protein, partial [Enterobacter hormaechei]|uniref:hypothetical protein n=1 Tax=Enterobacter hormaechei TaxID=158836 RepID=UPI000AC210A4